MNLLTPDMAVMFIAVGALVLAPIIGEWLADRYQRRRRRKASA